MLWERNLMSPLSKPSICKMMQFKIGTESTHIRYMFSVRASTLKAELWLSTEWPE